MSVEFRVSSDPSYELTAQSGPCIVRPYRIVSLARLDPDKECVDAIIDTGAMLSVLPQQVWEMAVTIDWLTQHDDPQIPNWLRFVRGLTDESHKPLGATPDNLARPIQGIPCRIARISLTLHDKNFQPVSPSFTVLAKCVLDGGKLSRRILIGLYGQPLEFGFHWSGGSEPRAWMDSPPATV